MTPDGGTRAISGSASSAVGAARKVAARAWPLALVAFLYLATSPYHQGLNNPNEMVRVYMTKAIVEQGTMAIDGVTAAWGPVDDKAIRNGKLYSSKAPLQSLVGVPIYAALPALYRGLHVPISKRTLTTGLRIFGSALPGIVFAGLLLAWARRRARQLDAPVQLGEGVALALALGTMLYPYALTFTGHGLAAFAAGGAYLALAAMSQHVPSTTRWRVLGVLLGLGAGAAPFAEYPAALVAAAAVGGALVLAPSWEARSELMVLLLLGGAAPFLLGLWAHQTMWGSPWRTGYGFLENRSYVEVHGQGFFGVQAPKLEAFAGSMFSPETGLFFFSPVLLVGLAALTSRCIAGRRQRVGSLPLSVAVTGLVAFLLEVLFISGHRGWRGGWTLGPRYIIPVAPVLGVWVVEALGRPRMRRFIAATGALSVVTTGFAAALYPHLSDVYTNPLKTFVVASYLRGEAAYGIGTALGLHGVGANLVHVVPLVVAIACVAFAGWRDDGFGARALVVAGAFALGLGIIAIVPERDPVAADRENARLWGFWEPPATPPPPPPAPQAPERPADVLFEARERWREVLVEAIGPGAKRRPCTMEQAPGRCRYGDQPWQHFGPDTFEMDGVPRPVLFLHPIQGSVVRATFPPAPAAGRAILRYGLADASVASGNKSPVKLRLLQGGAAIAETSAANVRGLLSVELTLTSTAPLALEISTAVDGARVFGFDLELWRNEPRE